MRRLIELLDNSQKGSTQKVLQSGLLDRLLTQLAESPAQPVEPGRRSNRERDLIGEEDQDDVNHALVWLLQTLDEKTQQTVYGPRLLRLRDRTIGYAQREVQLALDVLGIETRVEVDQVRRRSQGFKPVRSPAVPLQQQPHAVAFSRDGQFLASGDTQNVRIWKTRDWSLVATLPITGPINNVCFSPDSRSVYLTSPQAGVLRCDWRTGKNRTHLSNQGPRRTPAGTVGQWSGFGRHRSLRDKPC